MNLLIAAARWQSPLMTQTGNLNRFSDDCYLRLISFHKQVLPHSNCGCDEMTCCHQVRLSFNTGDLSLS